MRKLVRFPRLITSLGAVMCLSAALPVVAQDTGAFDDIEAVEQLFEISAKIESEDVNNSVLAEARGQAVRIETGAADCVADATEESARLEARFEPLRDIDSELVGGDVWEQRRSIQEALSEAKARQARCAGLVDRAQQIASRITAISNTLSQQFLSSRTQTIIGIAKDMPKRVPGWPAQFRQSLELELAEGWTTGKLLWLLVITGAVAAALGIFGRRRFEQRYQAAGGDSAPPSLKFLIPKPVAEFAPLWLESAVLVVVLEAIILNATTDLIVIRVAWALLWFSLGCVVINWATGPLSPAASVRGLIPDHVGPMRLRLRAVLLSICLSFVILGEKWAIVRISEPFIAGRAMTIVFVGVALILALDYARRVPGLAERFRLVRFAAIAVISVGIGAVLLGYQNLATFLVHGITRTFVALFIIWVIMWLVSMLLQFLLKEESDTAEQVRSSLGMGDKGSRAAVGFMRLVVDLVVWVLFVMYMLYVWDDSGTTLGQVYVDFFVGWELGGVTIIPSKIIGAVLIFALTLIAIGWLKRWIDRRWLQHFVMDRGSRDAITTFIGYVGFTIALLVALAMAEIDLTGLAWISAALALGIGFGMQEIASNFVSGLILLFERPIRAGDFVTVGDTQGFVRSIRIRATEIETLDNQNVLVPNSELVSGRVTNWVLRDTYGRLLVEVGVAYGSDVEKVRDILERIAREHPEVITDGSAPAPRALFMGFGDSSLDFELRVRLKHIERRFSIKSDLNFAIDEAFRAAGITVPFPQRDIHIISQAEAAETPAEEAGDDVAPGPASEMTTRSHSEIMETKCSIEEVWAAVTDIELLKRWLIREGSLSPHVGGAFNFALRDGYEVAGRFDVFIPPRRLRAIIVPLGDEAPLPTGPIMSEYLLQPTETGSQLTVTVSGIPDNEDWEEYFRLSVDRWQVALLELRKDVLGK